MAVAQVDLYRAGAFEAARELIAAITEVVNHLEVGVDPFPGVDKPTSRERLGVELADEQLDLIYELRKVRVERGLSIADIAENMKVDATQVSRLESGSTNPTMAAIRRYAKAAGARISISVWRDDQAPTPPKCFDCGLTVTSDGDVGDTYAFCDNQCRQAFIAGLL